MAVLCLLSSELEGGDGARVVIEDCQVSILILNVVDVHQPIAGATDKQILLALKARRVVQTDDFLLVGRDGVEFFQSVQRVDVDVTRPISTGHMLAVRTTLDATKLSIVLFRSIVLLSFFGLESSRLEVIEATVTIDHA